ncbi:tRNA (adenosine(37)-N6)-threonylcarbamoyltransferase complex transferase subunit TsaD [Arcobacter sp. FWKO B]|uniref:tRNA (adenosine(37)-N6)-threonylcarbamoyltransferase complex transferase subunit TsaD n=1 Tax=Arcobacter sp. FWKO B TaxID=2593672 RepID=UPI0018A4219E|nr:tRNA (adenosine(37)-N6)-threonylcarbamoyltransferase complex transferase subunit TsaD [Arcobacter sp. FWKO B]QOG12126.1 tRNA (adenosine(37)-N6)-threonylcarbamoyltransferase complex transferase subunit TsaD [Arcobacter sp. FWKO B]
MILSIESSCDDSSIAITKIDDYKLIYHKKISQDLEHSVYGGVVPELAARLHTEALPKILEECKEYFPHLKAIAVTNEPGLSVTLLEGVMMAKALSLTLNIPLIAVNHLKGHIYSLFINQKAVMPLSVLLVSGGHTQIIEATSLNNMKVVAKTQDDSFGESFDKVAKMLGLGYPGGPVVAKMAVDGDEKAYDFPIPLKNSPNIEFSYSGLKNAVRLAIESEQQNLQPSTFNLQPEFIQNICASFEYTAVAHLMQKLKKYFKLTRPKIFAIVGGASANIRLRGELEKLCHEYDCKLLLSPLEFCSDNAAMIGRCAIEQYNLGDFSDINSLDISPRSSF